MNCLHNCVFGVEKRKQIWFLYRFRYFFFSNHRVLVLKYRLEELPKTLAGLSRAPHTRLDGRHRTRTQKSNPVPTKAAIHCRIIRSPPLRLIASPFIMRRGLAGSNKADSLHALVGRQSATLLDSAASQPIQRRSRSLALSRQQP